jgi:hypothetical protein
MRLCGYDPGSAGSGRYFYRLDPQDPLNFDKNFLSLLLTRRQRPDPPCRLISQSHTSRNTSNRLQGRQCRPSQSVGGLLHRTLSKVRFNLCGCWSGQQQK